MLLILSDGADHSTNVVIKWLNYYKVDFQRVNKEDTQLNCEMIMNPNGKLNLSITDIRGVKYSINDYSSFWYRRGDWFLIRPVIQNHENQVSNILNQEWDVIRDTIHYLLENKPHLGSFNKEKYQNKIITLLIAASVGLKIPDTLISTEKFALLKFITKKHNVITKAIHNMFTLSSDKIRQAIGTKSVQKENISILNDYFFPVLVQEEIEKAYELRVFFMKDDFYAMAIFSQNDIQTKLDFRNYDRTKPNRNVPYCLPESVKLKLQEFNKQMGLDTGSIDLIVTPKNEFIFLEVNHIGQFGWLSDNCNYYIEEKIALYFKSIENEKKTNFYS